MPRVPRGGEQGGHRTNDNKSNSAVCSYVPRLQMARRVSHKLLSEMAKCATVAVVVWSEALRHCASFITRRRFKMMRPRMLVVERDDGAV